MYTRLLSRLVNNSSVVTNQSSIVVGGSRINHYILPTTSKKIQNIINDTLSTYKCNNHNIYTSNNITTAPLLRGIFSQSRLQSTLQSSCNSNILERNYCSSTSSNNKSSFKRDYRITVKSKEEAKDIFTLIVSCLFLVICISVMIYDTQIQIDKEKKIREYVDSLSKEELSQLAAQLREEESNINNLLNNNNRKDQ